MILKPSNPVFTKLPIRKTSIGLRAWEQGVARTPAMVKSILRTVRICGQEGEHNSQGGLYAPQKGGKVETVKVSEILDLVRKIHKDAQTAIHYLEGRILIGEINHPSTFSPPKIRKRRTKKEMEVAPKVKMDLEKEYQIERLPTLIPTLQEKNLPEDKDPFFAKAKRVYKKREKKVPVVE